MTRTSFENVFGIHGFGINIVLIYINKPNKLNLLHTLKVP